jgi:hypothetical protein
VVYFTTAQVLSIFTSAYSPHYFVPSVSASSICSKLDVIFGLKLIGNRSSILLPRFYRFSPEVILHFFSFPRIRLLGFAPNLIKILQQISYTSWLVFVIRHIRLVHNFYENVIQRLPIYLAVLARWTHELFRRTNRYRNLNLNLNLNLNSNSVVFFF